MAEEAVASVATVLTMDAGQYSAQQRKIMADNARYLALLKKMGASTDDLAGKTRRFQQVSGNSGLKALGRDADMASSSAMRLQNSIGLLDNTIRGQSSKAIADMVRGLSRFGFVMDALPVAAAIAGMVMFARIAGEAAAKIAAWTRSQQALTNTMTESSTAIGNTMNGIRDKMLEVQAQVDDLNGDHLAALHKRLELIDHASMKDLVQSFKEIDKQADAVFKKLQVGSTMSLLMSDAGSGGAKNAETDFARAYAHLGMLASAAPPDVAKQYQKQMSDLLAGTLSDARKVLAGQEIHQQFDKKWGVGSRMGMSPQGAAEFQSEYRRLPALPHGYGPKEMAAQRQLIQDLTDQQEISGWVAQTGSAKGVLARHREDKEARTSQSGPAYNLQARIAQALRTQAKLFEQNTALLTKYNSLFFDAGANGKQVFTAGPSAHEKADETFLPDGTAQRFSATRQKNEDVWQQNYGARAGQVTIDLKSGRISEGQAARRKRDLDTEFYQHQVDQHTGSNRQMADLARRRSQQLSVDNYNVQQTEILGRLNFALMDFAQQATNAARVLSNLAKGTLDSFNRAVVGGAMGQHHAFRGFGRNLVGQGTGALLQGAEGFGIKALLGKSLPKKADGYHVFVDNLPKIPGMMSGGAGSVVSSGLGSLLSGGKSALGGIFGTAMKFLPMLGFADGGSPPLHRPSIVGEHGPEIFNPGGVRGSIIPNHMIGGGSQTINIDARQSNPAAVHAAVMVGMRASYAAAVQTSAHQQRDQARRRA